MDGQIKSQNMEDSFSIVCVVLLLSNPALVNLLAVFTRDNGVSGLYSKSIDYSGFYFSLQTNPLLLQVGMVYVLETPKESQRVRLMGYIHWLYGWNRQGIGSKGS
ncbi:hypothetical protein ACOSQ2_018868 [Xanthoceras sorbifolium]